MNRISGLATQWSFQHGGGKREKNSITESRKEIWKRQKKKRAGLLQIVLFHLQVIQKRELSFKDWTKLHLRAPNSGTQAFASKVNEISCFFLKKKKPKGRPLQGYCFCKVLARQFQGLYWNASLKQFYSYTSF